MKIPLLIIVGLILTYQSYSQEAQDLVRSGNAEYRNGNYAKADSAYNLALSADPQFNTAQFNLGGSQFRSGKYMDAATTFTRAAEETTDKELKAEAYYNRGNSLLNAQKLEPAIESYKEALRNNPDHENARYNLAYAQKLLKESQEQQKNQDQNQDKNQEDQENQDKQDQDKKDQNKNKDDQKDGNKDQKENQEDHQDQGEQDNKNDQEQKQNQQKQQPKMSKADAERMLKASEEGEDKTLEKLNVLKAKSSKSKKIEKDW
jgi:Ca-activated chloride channel family protein